MRRARTLVRRSRASLGAVLALGAARLTGWAVVLGALGFLVGHASTRAGATGLRPALFVLIVALVLAGFRYRSAFTTGLGLAGAAVMWALSQNVESASGAVLVGGLVTLVAVLLSWLAEPPVTTTPSGHARRIGRLLSVCSGAAAVGLLALGAVDRQPAHRGVISFGVAAVLGVLALVYVLGVDPDAPEAPDRGRTEPDPGVSRTFSDLRDRRRSAAVRGAGVSSRRL